MMKALIVFALFVIIAACGKQPADTIVNSTTVIQGSMDSVWYYYGITDTAWTYELAIPRQEREKIPLGYIQYWVVYIPDPMADPDGKADSVWRSENALEFREYKDSLYFEFASRVKTNYRFRIPFLVDVE